MRRRIAVFEPPAEQEPSVPRATPHDEVSLAPAERERSLPRAAAQDLCRLCDESRAPPRSARRGLRSVHARPCPRPRSHPAGAAPAGAAERGPRLAPPVRGEVVRAFAYAGDPFTRGHHRGIDLAAAPGAPVRAACSGRVTFAGSAGASGRAVTIRCGAWSVTHLPLRDLAVRAGEHVVAGAPIGAAAAAPGHAGLHLGVRRASDRLGYVDPAPLLQDSRATASRRPAAETRRTAAHPTTTPPGAVAVRPGPAAGSAP